MTESERVELEACVDALNSLIADFHIISLKKKFSLDDGDAGAYYKKVVEYTHHLKRAISYNDVIAAKRNIILIKEKLAELEVSNDL